MNREFVANNIFVAGQSASTRWKGYISIEEACKNLLDGETLYYTESLSIYEAQWLGLRRAGYFPVDASQVSGAKIVLRYVDTFRYGFDVGRYDLYFAHYGQNKALLIYENYWMADPYGHSWTSQNPCISYQKMQAAMSFAREIAAKLNQGILGYYKP